MEVTWVFGDTTEAFCCVVLHVHEFSPMLVTHRAFVAVVVEPPCFGFAEGVKTH